MERIPEPELMDDAAQARAYARADFAQVNQGFVDRFCATFPDLRQGSVLDLGTGPADIPLRLARAAPGLRITAVDGSAAMLEHARRAVREARLEDRIRLLEARVPGLPLPPRSFDAVISNSLLHHLPDPRVFWEEVLRLGRPGGAVLVMDLFRPESAERAREIVEAAAGGEDPILKEDFYNSLLAAFTLEEVRAQLAALLPALDARVVSERHWVASGRLPGSR
jgi:ubiquinone/menaquinone biosynthesis C-methylase UbiE